MVGNAGSAHPCSTQPPLLATAEHEKGNEMARSEDNNGTTQLADLDDIRESLRELQDTVHNRPPGSEADVREDDDDLTDDGEGLSLATFDLPNGNVVRFIGSPSLGEVMVGEIAPCGAEQFAVSPTMHPVELFRRLAPKHSPAPRLLHTIDTAGLLEGRTVIDALPGPIGASGASLDQVTAQPITVLGAGSCAPGAAGADYFEDNHCGSLGGPGYGSSDSYCYEGAYDWIQKTSSARRRATYSRMAACGTGTCRLRHYYKKSDGYHTQLTVNVEADTVSKWWSYKKGIKRYRRVRFEAVDAGAWVRGWVIFHSQVADGW